MPIRNQKALASLVVHVGLDAVSLSKGLNAMKQTVRAATSEWKSQFSIFNQLGQHVEAAKAKYDGLTKSIVAQRKVIEEQQNQLKAMGQRTQENAADYDKLSTQINKNVQKLAALRDQQTKARHAYDFEKTGIRDNKKELSLLNKEMQATVKMYQAQGKEGMAARTKAQFLHKQIIQLNDVYSKESTLLQKIASESGKTSEAYRRQMVRVNDLKAQIADVNREYKNLGNSFSRFGDRLKNTGDRMSNIGQNMADKFGKATLVVGGGLGAAVKSAMDFDAQMSKVQATSGASSGELQKLRKSAIDLGASTSLSASQTAEAMNEMAKNGFNATQIIDSMPGVISAAEASGEDLALVSDTVSTAINSFGLNAKDASHIADVLAMSANKSSAGIEDMSYAFKYAAAPAHALGYNMEDVSAAIEIMANAGIRGESAGTALRASLLRMINPPKEASNELRKLGVSVTDSHGKMKPFADIMGQLNTKTSDMTKAQKTAALSTIFGTEAVSGMLPVVEAGSDKINKMTKDLQNSDGASAKTAKTMKDNLKGSIDGLTGSLESAAITVGSKLEPTIRDLTDRVKAAVDWFNKLSPATQETIVKVAAVSAGVLAAGTAFGAMTMAIGSGIRAIGSLIRVTGKIATAPVRAIRLLSQSFGGIKRGAEGVGKAVRVMGKGLATLGKWSGKALVSSIRGIGSAAKVSALWIGRMSSRMMSKAKLLAVAAGQKAITVATKAWTVAQRVLNVVLKANPIGLIITSLALLTAGVIYAYKHFKRFRDVVNNVWKFSKKAFSTGGKIVGKVMRTAGKVISKVIGNVKNYFSNGFDTIKKLMKVFKDIFTGNWKDLGKDVKGLVRSLWNTLKSLFRIGWDFLNSITKGALNKMWNKVKSTGSSIVKFFKNLPGNIWNAIKSTAYHIWNGMKWLGSQAQSKVSSWGSSLGRWFKGLPGRMWNDVKSRLGTVWSGISWLGNQIKSRMSKIGSKIADIFRKLPGRMADGIRRGAKSLGNAGISIGNKLIDGIEKVINGAIGGINWLLGKVSMPKIRKMNISHVPYFATGTVDSMGRFLKDMLVHVGDGNKHELVKHADGSVTKTPNRDTLMMMHKGDSILGGDKTEQLMKVLSSMPYFASGSWLGSAMDFIKGGWNRLKSAGSSIWDYMTHPTKILNTVVNRFAGSALGKLGGVVDDFASGLIKKIIKGAGKWLKDKVGSMGNPPGSGVQRWRPQVIRALGMNGLSTSSSMVNKVLRQIATESGGNPHAIQHGYTDINTLTGNLARGLMQTIPPTFNAYKFKGHGNIYNGFDNLLAALNYAKHRYGKNLSALGHGHGYANGGVSLTEQLAHISEGNKPEMILPLTDQNRTIQLMYQALDYLTSNNDNKTDHKSNRSSQADSGLISQLVSLQRQNNVLTETLIQVLQDKQFNVDGRQLANTITPYVTQEQASTKARQRRALGI